MILLGLAACGGTWQPQDFETLHGAFPLDCGHAAATCDSCHEPPAAPVAIDGACVGCHEEERPTSHDPERTADCSECHGTCDWLTASPHPSGFVEPDQHGLAFKLQDPAEGDCRDCHGAALDGGEAQGCDDCHTSEGIGDWRTDCVLCHGGELEPSGAPPVDIDDASPSSFAAHTAHVDDNGTYRATPCADCHRVHTDVLSDGHVLDGTPGLAEVVFDAGPSTAATYAAGTCSDLYCHGPGYYDEGSASAGDPPVTCGTCHAIDGGFELMSGVHDLHLEEPDIACHDCHASQIDAGGTILVAEHHVDGVKDVALAEPTITTSDAGGTCEGTCHGFPHDGTGWGHPPGYDAPEIHGQEALLQTLDCQSCHGADLADCDDCHQPDWRTDCAWCHGTAASGGLPPEDLDNTRDEAQISFMAHPEHADGDDHPAFGCESCHGQASSTYTDALLDPGHWLDGTPGVAEVIFDGPTPGGTFDAATSTCSQVYCHSTGFQGGSFWLGAVSDSDTGLGCGDCHESPPASGNQNAGSEEHDDHKHDRVSCDWCHATVAGSSTSIVGPNLHVDGQVQQAFSADANQWGGITFDPSTGRCSGTCHAGGDSKNHENVRWD